MKALSIKQPWASLIAHGIKNIENRTWRTNFRGRIYIHASAKASGDLYELLGLIQLDDVFNYWPTDMLPNMPLSAIIGEVDIVDCVINHDSIWAEHMKTHPCEDIEGLQILNKGQKYIWNWVLANPVLYDKPILNVKGKLSFWEFSLHKCRNCSISIDEVINRAFHGQCISCYQYRINNMVNSNL